MLSYIVGFLAVALFPIALAGYGGHLATLALTDSKKQRRAIWLVWSLALAGVAFGALQQIEAYHSDQEHNEKQTGLQGKLDSSLLNQEYTRGQLDSLSLMVGRIGEKTGNPGLKEFASAITAAIVKMTQQRPVPPESKNYKRSGTETLRTEDTANPKPN